MKTPTQPNPTQHNRRVLVSVCRAAGAAALLAGLPSCNKEAPEPLAPTAMAKADITPRVKAFVERARQGGHSTGRELATRDSAIWYLEAGVNYGTAQAWKTQGDVQADTVVLPFNFSGNSISEGELAGAYLALEHAAMAYNAPGRHLHVVDVVETPEQLATGQLMAICVWAEDGQRGAPNTSYPNGYQAYYKYPAPPYCSAWTTHGAHEIIQERINSANVLGLQPGQYLYDVETWSVYILPTSVANKQVYWKDPLLASATPANNGYHETLFFSWKLNSTTGSACLNDSEMSYWTGNSTTHGTWRGLLKVKQAYCPTKVFIDCHLVAGQFYPTAQPTEQYGVHLAQLRFGLVGNNNAGQ